MFCDHLRFLNLADLVLDFFLRKLCELAERDYAECNCMLPAPS